jgi:phage gp36-like protein
MSNFIVIADYDSTIHREILDAVVRNDDAIIDVAEDAAIQEMRGYLSQKYNCDMIFSASGTERNHLILMFAKDITVYHLFCIHNPMKMSKMREDRYNRAIEWLKDVQQGNIVPDGLPTISSDKDISGSQGTGFVMSSNVKRNNHFE